MNAVAPLASAESTIRRRERRRRDQERRGGQRQAVLTEPESGEPRAVNKQTSGQRRRRPHRRRSREVAARSKHRTTVTRKTEKEGIRSPTAAALVSAGWASEASMIGRSVRCAAPVDRMRIAFLTGIWPPDVGGPATHGPDFARFLTARGHEVHVVTMGDGEPAERPVRGRSRVAPTPVSRSATARWRFAVSRAAPSADVVYATATYAAAAAARPGGATPLVAQARLRPCVRARAALRALHRHARGVPAAPDRADAGAEGGADAALRRRATIVVPSAYLAEIAARLGSATRHGFTCSRTLRRRPRRSSRKTLEPGTFVFVGRLTRQKALVVAVDAIAGVPAHGSSSSATAPSAARARAPGRERIGGGSRVRFRRRCEPATRRLRVVAGAEAALLSSDWENLPHSAVEALSVGVPVVSTAVGGVPEVVHDGENGLLVPPGDGRGSRLRFGASSTSRVCATGWRRHAKPSVEALSSDAVYGKLEALLAEAAR